MSHVIGVAGLWHLGCVLSACWARLGHRVYGLDRDAARIENLEKGVPPLFEPHLEDSIRGSIASKQLSFHTDAAALGECDFVFVAYDTPVRDDDSSDVSILVETIADLAPALKDGAIVVVSSQSPVGLCAELRASLKAVNPSLELAYSPENLRLGEAIDCYLHPGRIILGTANDQTRASCAALFSEIDGDLITMGLESSEMVKHGINSFLSTTITFANHLADLCEVTGARIDDVVRGMKTDPRIGPKAYLSAGVGFSGGTLGRDLKVLDAKNADHAQEASLFGTIHALNDQRRGVVVNKLDRMLGGLANKRIGVLGLTYKPGTSTLRRSLPLALVEELVKRGAQVQAFDPKADYSEVTSLPKMEVKDDIAAAAEGVDALVLLTEWPEFKAHDWAPTAQRMKTPIFYDAKNFLDEDTMRKAGLRYFSIGRSTRGIS